MLKQGKDTRDETDLGISHQDPPESYIVGEIGSRVLGAKPCQKATSLLDFFSSCWLSSASDAVCSWRAVWSKRLSQVH